MPALSLYVDSALTTLATLPLAFTQDTLGAIQPHQRQFYLGSTDSLLKFEAGSAPGVDPITLQIVDTATGSGQPASAVKLATSQAGLTGATAGASLALGVQILSGVVNAVPVWVQFDDSTGAIAVDTALKLALNTLRVSAQ